MNMSILEASYLTWDRTKWRNTVHNIICAARARRQRHRRQGHKLSKSTHQIYASFARFTIIIHQNYPAIYCRQNQHRYHKSQNCPNLNDCTFFTMRFILSMLS